MSSRASWFVISILGALGACDASNDVPDEAPSAAIITIAGANSAEGGFADGPAALARFDAPEGLLYDERRNALYIADVGNHAIRKLDLVSLEVSTIAGVGGRSGSEDTQLSGGDIVVYARLNAPRNLVMSPEGDGLYFTDTGNHVIRFLDLGAGTVTTLFGAAGTTGTTDGVGTMARFGDDALFATWPGGLAIDTNDPLRPVMYVADSANNTLRVIDLVTREVTTVAGRAGMIGATDGPAMLATFNKPTGLAVISPGVVVIAEANNIDIRRYDAVTEQVSTIAGQAPANPNHYCENVSPVLPSECDWIDASVGTDARFRFPYGLAPDGTGGLWVVDSHNNVIRRFDPVSTSVTTVAGVPLELLDDIPHASTDSTDTTPGTFWHPSHAVSDKDGVMYVADRSANCLRRVVLGGP